MKTLLLISMIYIILVFSCSFDSHSLYIQNTYYNSNYIREISEVEKQIAEIEEKLAKLQKESEKLMKGQGITETPIKRVIIHN